MGVVTGSEMIATHTGRWNPTDVACIRRVSFENWNDASFDLALLLLLQPRPPIPAGWPDPNGKF